MIKSKTFCDCCKKQIEDSKKKYHLILGGSYLIKHGVEDENTSHKYHSHEYESKYDIFGGLGGGVDVCEECIEVTVHKVNTRLKEIFPYSDNGKQGETHGI